MHIYIYVLQVFKLLVQLTDISNMTHDIILSRVSLSVLCFVSHLLRVKHPNILQLVDVFETKKEYFLFLEL